MNRTIFYLAALVLGCLLIGAGFTGYQHHQDAKIADLQRQVAVHQAAEAEWHQKAVDALKEGQEHKQAAEAAAARADALQGKVTKLEAKLKAYQTPVPTDPSSLPKEAKAIAAALTQHKVPAEPLAPPQGPLTIGFGEEAGDKALALIIDGEKLPEAIAHSADQDEAIDTLKQEVAEKGTEASEQRQRAEHDEAALADETKAHDECKGVVKAKDGVIADGEKKLKAERAKKWFWGLGGAGITALILLL